MSMQRVPNLIGGTFVDSHSSDYIDVLNPVSKCDDRTTAFICSVANSSLAFVFVYLLVILSIGNTRSGFSSTADDK